MATPAKVRVHVPFPPIDDNGQPNRQSQHWNWIMCLEIPVNLLNDHHFSLKPYKWIRYATGVVVGARGHLSRNKEQFTSLDYDAVLLDSDVGDLFYHLDDADRGRMFPTDPQLANATITSSAPTTRRDGLRNQLLERDGTCVLTNQIAAVCDGVHLIAHSKGDDYISAFTRARSQDPDDYITLIDDVRNALLLNKLSHCALGEHVAFLVTPNFAMRTSDVVADSRDTRCTAHLFPPADPVFLFNLPSGSAVRVAPQDWPPDILFNAVYASAVMEHYSAPGFKETSIRIWQDHFYPDGIRSSRHAEQKKLEDERELAEEKKQQETQDRDERAQKRSKAKERSQAPEPDNFDLLMVVPYINFRDDQLKVFLETERERARVAERERVEAKIDAWREQLCN